MQLERVKYKIRCELGACKNMAAHTVRMERTGVRAALHVCDDCLRQLHGLIGAMLSEQSAEGSAAEQPAVSGVKSRKKASKEGQ